MQNQSSCKDQNILSKKKIKTQSLPERSKKFLVRLVRSVSFKKLVSENKTCYNAGLLDVLIAVMKALIENR